MKRYTPKVEQGLKYAIAMLEIDAGHIENSVKFAIVLEEGAEKPKLSPQDKKQMEEYRAAAEWLRHLVAGYQQNRQKGAHDGIFSGDEGASSQDTVAPDASRLPAHAGIESSSTTSSSPASAEQIQ